MKYIDYKNEPCKKCERLNLAMINHENIWWMEGECMENHDFLEKSPCTCEDFTEKKNPYRYY